mgnify:FL=1|tara:strand:- start:54 stop:266 length:213 start_codon:yes stop_codon:yes gene_type:complete
MIIKFVKESKKGVGEFHFSWKEIWILIRYKKFTFNEQFLDHLLGTLICAKEDLISARKNRDKEAHRKTDN